MKTIIIIVLIFLFSSFLCADTIYLKDGSKVEGEIKTVSEDEIVINVPIKGFEGVYEPRIIMQADVSRIEREEIKQKEKPKRPIKVEEKVEGKVKYEGKWVTPEEKEKLEKAAAEEEKEHDKSQYKKYYQSGLDKYNGAIADWKEADECKLERYRYRRFLKSKLPRKKDALSRLQEAEDCFQRARRYAIKLGDTYDADQIIERIRNLESEWSQEIKRLEEEIKKTPKELGES